MTNGSTEARLGAAPAGSRPEKTISKEGGGFLSCESSRTAVHREAKMPFQFLFTSSEGALIRVSSSLVHVAVRMWRFGQGTIRLHTTIGERRMKGIFARALATRIDRISTKSFSKGGCGIESGFSWGHIQAR